MPELEHHEEHERPTTTILPATIDEILTDAREDLQIISEVRADPTPLEKAVAGKALTELREQVAEEVRVGRIKVRQFDELAFEFEHVVEGTAGLSLVFTDRSYFVNNRGDRVSEPVDIIQRYILSMQKFEDQWKITGLHVPSHDLPAEKIEETAAE